MSYNDRGNCNLCDDLFDNIAAQVIQQRKEIMTLWVVRGGRIMLVDLASQEQSFIKCRGRMGVPISFLSKAIPVNGVFYRNNGAKIDHAVAVHNNGKVNFYELLDNLGDAKIDGKKKFSRILIWEVFPRRLTENEWREHVHNVCGGKNGRND